MVFKPDFSFDSRPVIQTTGSHSRSVSPKASCRTPLPNGQVSPSSKITSVMSSCSSVSEGSSMTSIPSLRRERYPSTSTVYTESIIDDGPVISPIRIRFDESYGFGEFDDSDDENGMGGKKGKASAIKDSIFRGLQQFPFHSHKAKKDASPPTSPKSPETPPIRATNKPNTQTTRATVNARFRLFKSAPKSTKNIRRPPPLNLQNPPKVSATRPKVEIETPPLASPIQLDDSPTLPEDCDFTKSPEAGVQLLFQTLSEESDEDDIPELEHTREKEEIFRSYSYHDDITPAYLSSPWFTASQGPSPISETPAVVSVPTAVRFPGSYLPVPSNIYESIPKSPVYSPLSPRNQQPIVKPALLRPASPIVQPPTPCSIGSPKSFLFDEGEETDIEDSPADFYARRPTPATSRRSSPSVSRRSSLSVSRKSSVSGSRKSSIATFFCRGQRPSLDRHNSIGLGSLTGDEVEIKDDAESVFYPGIGELKSKSSWLYTNPPEYSSSDDEDEDDDSEIEEAYQKHLSLITQIRKKSTSSLAASDTSTPDLSMSSSVSSVSSYGQVLATPPRRGNRRRTASSECIVLEALEQMQEAGMRKSRGLGILEDMDMEFGSEWADALWEMDSDEQVGWDWETQQVALVGV